MIFANGAEQGWDGVRQVWMALVVEAEPTVKIDAHRLHWKIGSTEDDDDPDNGKKEGFRLQ